MKRQSFKFSILFWVLLAFLLSCTQIYSTSTNQQEQEAKNATQKKQKDDWVLKLQEREDFQRPKPSGKGTHGQIANLRQATPSAKFSQKLGLAVGGAKDVHNFRENIENGYMPLPTDITYEGLFYDYKFQTAQDSSCEDLFCPSYESWISPDPFAEEDEYFLSVGLQSGLSEADFRREDLNLVVVLDISGSMSSPFNRYYYDRFGNRIQGRKSDQEAKRKMEVAKESLVALSKQLRPSDRFGLVVFNNQAHLAKPLNLVSQTDMEAIRKHIRQDLAARGGTNMSAGLVKGSELFKEADLQGRENRIIFMTDAMPNLGVTSQNQLGNLLKEQAKQGVHTTFVGIGVDFNTKLIEALTKIRGANYYSVHNEQEFKDKLTQGFKYMVYPLVFDLGLTLKAKGFDIEKVFGSPEANEATGEMLYVKTLFPSPTSEKGVRGGIIIVKLKKTGRERNLQLEVSYEDRQGQKHLSKKDIIFNGSEPSTGFQKGVLLSRYASLLKAWIIHDRSPQREEKTLKRQPERFKMEELKRKGIPVPGPDYQLGKWERQSQPLYVSPEYKKIFHFFSSYLAKKSKGLQDETLKKEVELLEKLANFEQSETKKDKQDDWQYK